MSGLFLTTYIPVWETFSESTLKNGPTRPLFVYPGVLFNHNCTENCKLKASKLTNWPPRWPVILSSPYERMLINEHSVKCMLKFSSKVWALIFGRQKGRHVCHESTSIFWLFCIISYIWPKVHFWKSLLLKLSKAPVSPNGVY